MKTPSITLKEYIISQNYRREVQHCNKKRIPIQQSKITQENNIEGSKLSRSKYPGKYVRYIKSKVQEVKLLARSLIPKDCDFIRLEKKIEQLKNICFAEIETERYNQQLIKSIIEVGSVRSKLFDSKSTMVKKKPQASISNYPLLGITIHQPSQNSIFQNIQECPNDQNNEDEIKQSKLSALEIQFIDSKSERKGPLTENMEEINKWNDEQNMLKNTTQSFQKQASNIYYPVSLLKKSQTPLHHRGLSKTSEGFGRVRFKTLCLDQD